MKDGSFRPASPRIGPRAAGSAVVVSALVVSAAVTAGARAVAGEGEGAMIPGTARTAARNLTFVRAADASEKDVEKTRHPEPARTKGWSWKLPPDLVRPSSPKRNNVFYLGERVTFTLGASAATYEVRDYQGGLVDGGPAGEEVTLNVTRPGWYKLYVYGRETRPEWGDIAGATTFVIFRDDPNFPELPPKGTRGSAHSAEDQVMRGVIGMGPQRHPADAAKPDETINKRLKLGIETDAKLYLPYDPVRKRALMIAFSGGTKGKLAGVRKVVEHFKDRVKYWEPRNEPNYGSSGADFVENELRPFREAVKAVDPAAKIMGPGTVGIGPQLRPWLADFFGAGGGRYLDAFSFHIYNGINGDLFLSRRTMNALREMLVKYGLGEIEKWQTEQGFFACVYGSYQPRLQGRWTMLEMMIFEQYGIPKEHNHLWYDRSHGFWDFPTWWENEDGGLNPAAAMMRVWAEELHGTAFKSRLDFGKDGNKLFLGSLFEGPGKSVAAFMNAGAGRRKIALRVRRGERLRTVSAFGVEEDVPVVKGLARLTVPEVPVYVELEEGQEVEPLTMDWGGNLARLPGVEVTSSGTGAHPVDGKIPNASAKLVNGFHENWYWGQQAADQEWMDDTDGFPAWVAFRLPAPREVARVVVFAGTPWQWRGTLVDHELQYEKRGRWITIERVREPTKTWGVYSPATRTTVDSFFSDRWIFEHRFEPVKTAAVRLLVHDVTWGGGATGIVPEAGGQTGPHKITLREVEIYGAEPAVTVRARVDSPCFSGAFERTPVTVTVVNRSRSPARSPARVEARLSVPEGWKAEPAELSLRLDAGEARACEVGIVPPREMPAGPVPVKVALTDGAGRELDRDEVTLKVFGPVDLAPQPPSALDAARQPLEVVATNVTDRAVRSSVRLEAREIAPGARRTISRNQPLSIPPHGRETVRFAVPGLDLTRSAWRVTYQTRIGRMLVSASQDLAVRAWMVAGPFPNEFDRDFGPETAVDLAKRYAVRGRNEPAGWRQTVGEASGFVDLVKCFDPHDNTCAYAACYVECPDARKARLSAGSDDGVKIWLNGKLVVSNDVARGAAPGQEAADVTLRAGWNEVLLKITQGGGGWGFYFDLLGDDGKPMPDIRYAPRRPGHR